jgi:hypothetical protein
MPGWFQPRLLLANSHDNNSHHSPAKLFVATNHKHSLHTSNKPSCLNLKASFQRSVIRDDAATKAPFISLNKCAALFPQLICPTALNTLSIWTTTPEFEAVVVKLYTINQLLSCVISSPSVNTASFNFIPLVWDAPWSIVVAIYTALCVAACASYTTSFSEWSETVNLSSTKPLASTWKSTIWANWKHSQH